jgi:hypothetical protein
MRRLLTSVIWVAAVCGGGLIAGASLGDSLQRERDALASSSQQVSVGVLCPKCSKTFTTKIPATGSGSKSTACTKCNKYVFLRYKDGRVIEVQ